MQNSKKVKGWVKETSDIRVFGEDMKKEIDKMNSVLKSLQIEVDRILKALDMKSYSEELREKMIKVEKRHTN
ncbi:MAG: hypothetical protein ACW96S_02815 [Promethearchaeota archaeon]|jgi:hypothetical protein